MTPDDVKPDPHKSHQSQNVLQHALLMTELGVDLKDRYVAGEKYICYLKTVLTGADKAMGALRVISRSSLLLAQKLIEANLAEPGQAADVRNEFEKLLALVEEQLGDFELRDDDGFEPISLAQISEKIKGLETKRRSSESVFPTNVSSSNRGFKSDIDEKYPENLSRESLIDLNNIANLPPVPEDIFTSFSSKPMRSSSLSSLKSMRKVKLFLQKAESSDDEADSSDTDEHDYSKLVYGDTDDIKASASHSPLNKKHLGNIKEETQD